MHLFGICALNWRNTVSGPAPTGKYSFDVTSNYHFEMSV